MGWMPGARVGDGIIQAEQNREFEVAASLVGVAESSHQWMGIVVVTA